MNALWFQTFPSAMPQGAAALRENDAVTEKGLNYHFSPELIAAVEVAIGLKRPLLVTGEPGCGKTELGYAIARHLGLEQLYYFGVKSTSDARDALYAYDAIERFGEAQTRHSRPGEAPQPPDVGEYIRYLALGQAILDAHNLEDVRNMLRAPAHVHPGRPRRSVVVIDEIDKATRDFPNDLLREIEDMSFRVPEYVRGSGGGAQNGATPSGDGIRPENRPVVIVTSNQEHQLPDAFLRRCVFFEVRFPEKDALREILEGALRKTRLRIAPGQDLSLGETDGDALINLIFAFRGKPVEKKPGLSEAIDAAHLVALPAAGPAAPLGDRLRATRSALAKLKVDGALFDETLRAMGVP